MARRKQNLVQPPPAPVITGEAVEVVDASDHPVAVLDLGEVHRQALPHRSVLILIYNPEGKVFLQRRSKAKSLYPGRWDVSCGGHVQAAESREDAAIRELKEELDLDVGRLTLRFSIPAAPRTGQEFMTVYSVSGVREAPRPNPIEVDGGYFFDSTELAGLMAGFRELLTPALVHLWEHNHIFPRWDS